MPVSVQDLSREPEFLEKTLYYCEKKKIFQCVSISAKLNRSPNEDAVYGSLRLLVLKYPLLFSRVEEDGGKVMFVPVDEIRFEEIYLVNDEVKRCFKEDGAETRILTNVSFYNNHLQKKALWKIVYYTKTGWLTFHSAHCFTDGGSVVAYLKDFVEGLNNVAGVKQKGVLFNLEADLPRLSYGISPGFFDRINYNPGLATRLVAYGLKLAIALWPGIIPNVMEKKRFELFFVEKKPQPFLPDRFFESPYIIDEESGINSTTANFIYFDHEQVQRMIHACRANQVKLQSYLLLAYAHTINQLYPELYKQKYWKAGVAASFRNRFECLQSHNSYLGNKGRFDDGFYTYAATFLLEPETMFTWDTVRKYHTFLHQKIGSEEWISQYYVAQSMTAEDYLDHRFGKEKDDLFLSSTNLGHIDLLQYEDPSRFQIEDILFAPSAGALLGTHHMTVSSTVKNGLNIGFTNGDPNIGDWDEFKRALKENLLLLLNN